VVLYFFVIKNNLTTLESKKKKGYLTENYARNARLKTSNHGEFQIME